MGKTIGFIGLGIMGAPMAANILKAGYPLLVYNRSAEKAEPLAQAGAAMAKAPADVAVADTIILMLTGPEAIEAVLHGEKGLLSAPLAGKLIINMSTIPPAYTVRLGEVLAKQGAMLIDAPVSGSKKPAEDGQLIILAGGDEAQISVVEPLLLSMGKQIVRCGDIGTGSAMKMAINLLISTMMAGLAEALTLAEHCNLDPGVLIDTILAGPLGCALFRMKRDMLVSDTYPAQFPYKHMAKDLNFILQTAEDTGTRLPLGQAVAKLYNTNVDPTLENLDFAAVKRMLATVN